MSGMQVEGSKKRGAKPHYPQNYSLHSNKNLLNIGQSTFSVEQYRYQLARVRLLEDELMTEKLKSESIENKALTFIDTIQRLEYTILDLQGDLQKNNEQLQLQMRKDEQIDQYEHEMKEVGTQIASLNETLLTKSKECEKLQRLNSKANSDYEQLKREIKGYFENRKLVKSKLSRMLAMFDDEQQPLPFRDSINSIDDGLLGDLQHLQEYMIDLKQQLQKSQFMQQKNRRQFSQQSTAQKQQAMRMKYELQLAIKRNMDQQSKKNIESTFMVDRKTEQIIEQMLKKEDELSLMIADLQTENQQLKDRIQVQMHGRQLYDSLKTRDLEDQNRKLKQQIKNYVLERTELMEKLEEANSESSINAARSINQEIEISKRYREVEEQRKKLVLKVRSLESDKQMLQKQLSLRGNKRAINQGEPSF